jgi:hypothetical protein
MGGEGLALSLSDLFPVDYYPPTPYKSGQRVFVITSRPEPDEHLSEAL